MTTVVAAREAWAPRGPARFAACLAGARLHATVTLIAATALPIVC